MTDQAIPQHQRERKRQNHSNYEFKKKNTAKIKSFHLCTLHTRSTI